MYYSGGTKDENDANKTEPWTSIFVAQSKDGKNFKKHTDDKGNTVAIIQAANRNNVKVTFGAGQPSVSYDGERFVMLYTDTTLTSDNTPALVMIRCKSPLFDRDVECLHNTKGWVKTSKRTILQSPAADTDIALQENIVLFTTNSAGNLAFGAWNPKNLSLRPSAPVSSIKMSNDSGFVRTPTGQMDYTTSGNFRVMCTVLDPKKDEKLSTIYRTSIQEVKLHTT